MVYRQIEKLEWVGNMDIIDFAKAREARLAKAAKEKAGPYARYKAMVEALDREDLTAMEYIAQNHALQMAYKIVEHTLTGVISQEILPCRSGQHWKLWCL